MTIRVTTPGRKAKRRAAQARSLPWVAAGAVAAYAVVGAAPTAAQERGGISASAHPAGQGRQPIRRFEITAGPLDAALRAYETIAEVTLTVLVPAENLAVVNTAGVTGDLTSTQALRQLLAGTGMMHRFTGPAAATIELRAKSETVTVTGQAGVQSPKYTVPVRDIPQTITIVPSNVIEDRGAATLRDVLRNVTGISMQAGEGGVPAGDNLSVRGFNARTDMFIDGVRDFGAYSRDPFNLEQVEVSKGPSSSYSGRGSTGGSINLVSKSPQVDASRTLNLGAGSADYKRGTFDLNQPINLGPKGTSFRVNALWTDGDTPGRGPVGTERWGVAPSLAFGLGTRTRATLSYFRMEEDNLAEYGLPWVPSTNTNPALVPFIDQAPPVRFDNFYGLTTRDYEKTWTNIATAAVEHDIRPTVRVRNVFRRGETRRDSVITAPRFATTTGTALNRQLQSRDQTDDILVNQTDLRADFKTGIARHQLVAGVEVAEEGSENFLRTGPAAPTADLFDPNPADPYPGPIVRSGAVNTGTADSLAFYAFDTIHLDARLEVSGGLRWDRFSADYAQKATTGVVTPFVRTDEMLSGRVGIVFKPRPNGSIYAGYGTSFNPSAEGLTLSAATAAIEPEKSRSYEIGSKWDVSRLALSAAFFRTEKTNARTPGINPGDAPTVLLGEQRIDGMELGIAGRLTPRWEIYGGYAFLDSEITASNTPAEVGRSFGNTPRHSLSLWSTYRLPKNAEVGGGAAYVGERTNSTTTPRIAPGYWTIDALAAYPVSSHLTLRLNGYNLADERYIDRIGGGHFIPGAGRAAQLSAQVRF